VSYSPQIVLTKSHLLLMLAMATVVWFGAPAAGQYSVSMGTKSELGCGQRIHR
jgi:hypothetical protein